jgi:hypothetical protein
VSQKVTGESTKRHTDRTQATVWMKTFSIRRYKPYHRLGGNTHALSTELEPDAGAEEVDSPNNNAAITKPYNNTVEKQIM